MEKSEPLSLDHFVLTVRSLEDSVRFYEALGMSARWGDRVSVHFGRQKINLHAAGQEHAPHASRPEPGSADFCLLYQTPMNLILSHLEEAGLEVEVGPVRKNGALFELTSVYLRDPDGNLVELATPS